MPRESTTDHEATYDKEVFDMIFGEAFESGTGISLAADAVTRAEIADYERKFIDTYLETATDPDVVQPETPPEITIIPHPCRDSFTHEDIGIIARVSFFGRKLIDTAREGLLNNNQFHELLNMPEVKSLGKEKDQIINATFVLLKVASWHRIHENAEGVDTSSQAPDVASPLRVLKWPKGEYINCLGASIAMSAACEIADIDYLFVNELQSSDNVISECHQDFVSYMERLIPGFFNRPEVKKIFDVRDSSAVKYKKPGDDVFYDPPPSFTQTAQARDFHHSVLANYYDDSEDWSEIDPYALTFSNPPLGGGMQELCEYLKLPGNTGVVANVDISGRITDFFRQFNTAIRSLHSQAQTLVDVCRENNTYKSSRIFSKITDRLREILQTPMSDLYPGTSKEKLDEYTGTMAFVLVRDMVTAFYMETTGDTQTGEKYISSLNKLHNGAEQDDDISKTIFESYRKMEQEVLDRIRQDTKTREEFYSYLEVLPYIILADFYRYDLINFTAFREHGSPDIAAEYSQPEFMIGAMYLNHYATWRSDGKINAASYLADVCSSQLLWQSSMQDREENMRAKAVGRLITKMKPSQLHPRVDIARALIRER